MFKYVLFAVLLASPVFTVQNNFFIETLRPFRDDIRSWIGTIGTDGSVGIQADYFGCDLCSLLIPLVGVALDRYEVPQIQAMVITACKVLDLAPQPEVCAPIVLSYTDQFLYILGKNPNAKSICGILNSGCGDVDPNLENWRITVDKNKPEVASRPRIPHGEVETIKILQFTDIHLDPDYKAGTTTECGDGMPICCRQVYGNPPNSSVRAAGKFGDFNCALPIAALDAMYNHSKVEHSDAKYIFLTGDYVHSGVWLYSEEANSKAIKYATEKLASEFPTSTKIYPLTGNHEPHVVNLYPPVDLWGETPVISNVSFSIEWMYKLVLDPFIKRDPTLLPLAEQERFLKFGYYSVSPEPGLRLLAINTNLCYDQNFWLAYYPQDPNGQLQWLADELWTAEIMDENVIIIGHVQPEGCWPVWSDKFHSIINRFEGIIRAQFYGHSHRPQHRVTFEKGTSRGTSVSFIAGSALTDGMNPGYAVYHFDGVRDGKTWDVVSQELVILKLQESNQKGSALFETLINTTEHFGMRDLRPDSVIDLAMRMICDQQLLDNYLKFYAKGADSRSYKACSIQDNVCKADIICHIVSSDSSDPGPCKEMKRMIESTKCRNERDGMSSSAHNVSNVALLAVSFFFFCLVFKH